MALTSKALCTLDQLKSFTGTAGTHNDTRMELNIEAASQKIIDYIGYDPHTQSYTDEKHWGDGSTRVYTKARPITTITALSVDDASFTVANLLNYTTYLDTDGFTIPKESEVLVSYTAGYSTIPYGITMACLQIASYYEAQQDATGLNGLSSRSNGDSSRTVREGFIDEVLRELDEYRREV